MKVPDIYDIVELEVQSIRDKEERIKQLETDPLNLYICISLRKEVKESKKLLSKFRKEMRNEKLKKLGI